MEKKLRIYIETSVISHLDAPDRPDRMGETLLFWENVLAGKYEIVVGTPVITELERCCEPKQSFMLDELDKVKYDTAKVTEEAERLASQYIRIGGLRRKSAVDAMHIALATLTGCEVIVSWNFSHIVNVKAMTAVDAVNTLEGLRLLRIVAPTALLGREDDD